MLNDQTMAVIYLLCMFVIWGMYVIAVFNGIFLETHFRSRMKLGYSKYVVRSLNEILWWCLGFLPKKSKASLKYWWKNRKEAKEEQHKQEEDAELNETKAAIGISRLEPDELTFRDKLFS